VWRGGENEKPLKKGGDRLGSDGSITAREHGKKKRGSESIRRQGRGEELKTPIRAFPSLYVNKKRGGREKP